MREPFALSMREKEKYVASIRAMNAAVEAAGIDDWRANIDHYKTMFKKSNYDFKLRYHALSGVEQGPPSSRNTKRMTSSF